MSDLFQRAFDALHVGDEFATRGRTITEADVGLFAGLTGDHHPLHTDAVFAASHPFGERVAHGLLVMSCAMGGIPFDPDFVVALRRVRDVVFKRPVRLGDTIHVDGAISQLSPLQDDVGLVACDVRVRNQDEALVCRVAVEVLWRRAAPTSDKAAEIDAEHGDFVATSL
jgi:acyl dehydratase